MMTELPDFLNRKLNPQTPATVEERREYAARTPEAVQVAAGLSLNGSDEEALRQIEEQERAKKKEKTDARIAKLVAKQLEKSGRKNVPDEFLAWDWKTQRFYDVRVRANERLAAAFKRHGLKTPPADFYPRVHPFPWDAEGWAKRWKAEVVRRAA